MEIGRKLKGVKRGRKDDEELEGQTVEFSMLLNVAVNADSVP